MSQFNWPDEIVRICRWKDMAATDSPELLSPWSLPKVAAKPDAIAAAEAAVGFKFPEGYLGFLRHANGWEGIVVRLSLFGTPDFISGRAMEVMKRPGLIEAVVRLGFRPDQCLPIGAASDPKYDNDVFLLVRPDSPVLAGGVVWVDGEDISESDLFVSFEEFFQSLVDHNEALALQAAARRKQ